MQPPAEDKEPDSQVKSKLEEWKRNLLDLSERSPLLYLNEKRTLETSAPEVNTLFNRLVIRQGPYRVALIEQNESLDGAVIDQSILVEEKKKALKSNELLFNDLDPKHVERTLRKLRRECQDTFEDKGINILYLAVGLLRKSIENSTEIKSPILMVPVSVVQKSALDPYEIVPSLIEDEVILNPALKAKLSSDFRFDLPDPPDDYERIEEFDEYLQELTQLVSEKGCQLELRAFLGIFKFQKFEIYHDLEENAESISQNLIIQALSGKDVGDQLRVQGLPEEKDLDKYEKPNEIFHVLSADGSQRVAIDYAMKGQSFVMNGPPGTGKSQTIANMIALGLEQNKKILFVSEKTAALDVVYRLLQKAKLDDFCLDLHDRRANKKAVVDALKHSLDNTLQPGKLPTQTQYEELISSRERLNQYVQGLHAIREPLGESAFQVMGKVAGYQSRLLTRIPTNLMPLTISASKLQEYVTLLNRVAGVWDVLEQPDFPWRGLKIQQYDYSFRSSLEDTLGKVLLALEALPSEGYRVSEALGLPTPKIYLEYNNLCEIALKISASPRLEENWLTAQSLSEYFSDAKELENVSSRNKTLRTQILAIYEESVLQIDSNKQARIIDMLTQIGSALGESIFSKSDLFKNIKMLLEFFELTVAICKKLQMWTERLRAELGLQTDLAGISRLRDIAQTLLICYSNARPLCQWTDPEKLTRVKEQVSTAKIEYQLYNDLTKDLLQKYDQGFFGLDLASLAKSLSSNAISLQLKPSCRRDKQLVSSVAIGGKIPKSILQDLNKGIKRAATKNDIDKDADTLRDVLEGYYHEYGTDFPVVESALHNTDAFVAVLGAHAVNPDYIKILLGVSPPESFRIEASQISTEISQWMAECGKIADILSKSSTTFSINGKDLSDSTISSILSYALPIRELLQRGSQIIAEVEKHRKASARHAFDYNEFCSDLEKVAEVQRIVSDFRTNSATLSAEFGTRFKGLDTNWQEVNDALNLSEELRDNYHGFLKTLGLESDSAPSESIPLGTSSKIVRSTEGGLDADYFRSLLAEVRSGFSSLHSLFDQSSYFDEKELLISSPEKLTDYVLGFKKRIDDIRLWISFNECKKEAGLLGIGAFFDRLCEIIPDRDLIRDTFLFSFYEEWLESLWTSVPSLGQFTRQEHEATISQFRQIDAELLSLAIHKIIQDVVQRRPRTALDYGDSQISILNDQAARSRGIFPIRKLFKRLPELFLQLKPCLLMSPLAVSRYLPPDARFDLVIFDEASQVLPADAICAIYRGKTIVVAGDNKQLPPTSFFESVETWDDYDEENDENDKGTYGSVLDALQGIGLPIRTLQWHYRSRHENLIAFSNHAFYSRTLITFPSPSITSDLGVHFVFVEDGLYDRGGTRTNVKEAQKVVELVSQLHNQNPDKSIGVVAFSIAQRDAIDNLLYEESRKNPELNSFVNAQRTDSRPEVFFNKNLENVQGDERDIIVMSVGYGKDIITTKVSRTFGPLNRQGGERRLNVAITRSRDKVIVVSSIRSQDIPAISSERSPDGVEHLRRFLQYAESGPRSLPLLFPSSGANIADFESPFEEEVAKEIRLLGYDVDSQVGTSNYRIDLGVRHRQKTGVYLLGIECDGASYHSSYNARDRDRIREEKLGDYGWTLHRIWSTSWIQNKRKEIELLTEAIRRAEARGDEISISRVPLSRDKLEGEDPAYSEIKIIPTTFSSIKNQVGVPYRVWDLGSKPSLRRGAENDQLHTRSYSNLIRSMLLSLVENEGPIHRDNAVRRIALAAGYEKSALKIARAVELAIGQCKLSNSIVERKGFLWPANMNVPHVRFPVEKNYLTYRKIQEISEEELELAMKNIIRLGMSLEPESIMEETARLFGFNRTGDQIRETLQERIGELLKSGEFKMKDGYIHLDE